MPTSLRAFERAVKGCAFRRPIIFVLALVIAGLAGSAAGAPAAAVTSAYRSEVLNDGPVAYWRLGEASGTVARDEGGAHDGRYRHSPWLSRTGLLTADTNTATRFDGITDDAVIGNGSGLNPRSKLTLEAWIKPTRLPLVGKRATVIAKSGSWRLAIAGPNLEFALRIGGVDRRLMAARGTIGAGIGYYVAATYDGAYQRLYVNG